MLMLPVGFKILIHQALAAASIFLLSILRESYHCHRLVPGIGVNHAPSLPSLSSIAPTSFGGINLAMVSHALSRHYLPLLFPVRYVHNWSDFSVKRFC